MLLMRIDLLACSAMVMAFGSNLMAADCDRACLKGALDQYLNAVVKHDPTAANLFVGFRQTENAVVVRLGTGTWKSVTGLGKLQRRYLDPVSEQAAYFGIVEEGSEQAIVTVRVRVENHKVTEAEWLIARKNNPGLNGLTADGKPSGNFFDPDQLAANPPAEKPAAKEVRSSREAMIAATNSYLTASPPTTAPSWRIPVAIARRMGTRLPARAERRLPRKPTRRPSTTARRIWRTSMFNWSRPGVIRSWTRKREWFWRSPCS